MPKEIIFNGTSDFLRPENIALAWNNANENKQPLLGLSFMDAYETGTNTIDIIDAIHETGLLISPIAEGSGLPLGNVGKFDMLQRKLPTFGEMLVRTETELRRVDMIIGNSRSGNVAAAVKPLYQDDMNLIGRMMLTAEAMFWQAARTLSITLASTSDGSGGAWNVTLDDTSNTWKSAHWATPTTKWGATGSDPTEDMRPLLKAARDMGYPITDIVFGSAAWTSFCKNGAVKSFVNSLIVNKQVNRENSVQILSGIDGGESIRNIHVYSNGYQTAPGSALKSFVDPNEVYLFCNTQPVMGLAIGLDDYKAAAARGQLTDTQFTTVENGIVTVASWSDMNGTGYPRYFTGIMSMCMPDFSGKNGIFGLHTVN